MTRQPPTPQAVYEARVRAARLLNLIGLALFVAAFAGLAFIAWSVDPRIVYASACVWFMVLGYWLATQEAE